jgi:molybdopterin-guanine dinucleotide biosynthesis protein A
VVILAGGRSSRFGRDKLAEPIGGRSLLGHAIDAVRPIATEIVVVGAPDATPDVPDDVRVIHDPVAFEGPLAGARVGLAAARESTVVIVGGDMPDLVVAVLASMVEALDGFDVVALEDGGRPRPLPIVVRRMPTLEAAGRLLDSGERRLRALLESLVSDAIPEATWRRLDPEGRTMHDIDTEADLP